MPTRIMLTLELDEDPAELDRLEAAEAAYPYERWRDDLRELEGHVEAARAELATAQARLADGRERRGRGSDRPGTPTRPA